jgi:hypothetical protein
MLIDVGVSWVCVVCGFPLCCLGYFLPFCFHFILPKYLNSYDIIKYCVFCMHACKKGQKPYKLKLILTSKHKFCIDEVQTSYQKYYIFRKPIG